ncbi:hypothetical protein M514_10032 [Trichuris suis]|uniref:Uncharacterized protein n=1 Tax=Trichuris suis TaxID=68888 RepID=A0A085NCA0_9BILA|nr:hypothetical protein M513_10032 [Trichuris suis]KFD67096.1 hypothetical protein M514_10032 [Trichuris suis]
MYKDHMKPLTWYRNAVNRLKNGLHSNGSPPDIRSARSNGPIPSDVDYSATRGALRRPATPNGALQRKPIYD